MIMSNYEVVRNFVEYVKGKAIANDIDIDVKEVQGDNEEKIYALSYARLSMYEYRLLFIRVNDIRIMYRKELLGVGLTRDYGAITFKDEEAFERHVYRTYYKDEMNFSGNLAYVFLALTKK